MKNKKLKGETISFEGEVFTFSGVGMGGRFPVASVEASNGETLDQLLIEHDCREVRVTVEFLD